MITILVLTQHCTTYVVYDNLLNSQLHAMFTSHYEYFYQIFIVMKSKSNDNRDFGHQVPESHEHDTESVATNSQGDSASGTCRCNYKMY